MAQTPLPAEYVDATPEELDVRIRAAKAALGSRLLILGHHYQRDEIVAHADIRGDSYKLAKAALERPEAEFIVFCGVHFMAETADILVDEGRQVILPNLAAGCSMAEMANIFQVERCWRDLSSALRPVGAAQAKSGGATVAEREPQGPTIVPVTYVNSVANLKAFVGKNGGTVCTSTNAPAAVRWALGRGDKVLFFPDQHLGRNTGVKLGYDPDRDMVVWDPFKPLGGNSAEDLARSTFILWKGHCSVHKRFTVDQIARARTEYPGIKIVVHPECELDVVLAADLSGSTEFIVDQIATSPDGSAWGVGTEINLVSRLAKQNPNKTIFCLDPLICPCSTMYRIHPSFLCWALESIVRGEPTNVVTVPNDVKRDARIALDRMLNLD